MPQYDGSWKVSIVSSYYDSCYKVAIYRHIDGRRSAVSGFKDGECDIVEVELGQMLPVAMTLDMDMADAFKNAIMSLPQRGNSYLSIIRSKDEQIKFSNSIVDRFMKRYVDK